MGGAGEAHLTEAVNACEAHASKRPRCAAAKSTPADAIPRRTPARWPDHHFLALGRLRASASGGSDLPDLEGT